MSILGLKARIAEHHHDEKRHVEDAPGSQKVRVSGERRILNFEKLMREEIPECQELHEALGALHNFRIAFEKAVDRIPSDKEG